MGMTDQEFARNFFEKKFLPKETYLKIRDTFKTCNMFAHVYALRFDEAVNGTSPESEAKRLWIMGDAVLVAVGFSDGITKSLEASTLPTSQRYQCPYLSYVCHFDKP